MNSAIQFKTDYLELASWKKWLFSFVIDQPKIYKRGSQMPDVNKLASDKAKVLLEKMKKVKYDDDIAIEVLNFRKSLVEYGGRLAVGLVGLFF